MGSRKWDYSKTFARFLVPVPPFVAIHSSFRIMTSRVYGAATVAFTKRKRAAMPCRVASPFLFRRFNCCANICLAAIGSTVEVQEHRHVNNTITDKVTRIDLGSSRLANDSFIISCLSPIILKYSTLWK